MALLLWGTPGAAQRRHVETLEVGAAGVAAVGETYDGLWRAEPGGALRVGTEFYGGQAHVDFHAFANQPEEKGLPEFHAYRGEVGWGVRVGLPGRLRLVAGPAVGAVHYRFEPDERFPMALQNETELSLGLFARLDAPLLGPARVFAGAEVVRVYTAERIVYPFVEGGVALSTPAPRWLRRLLR
ncbi:MAG TPA: hypothetical protein VD962_08910 [Rubricoccaceae bacterium]|nr:hypothetical protein [Rubricoccaceae bacterium]